MPISSLADVVPTINEFLAHWSKVNAYIGPNPLTLTGPYTIGHLIADRDSIQTYQGAVLEAEKRRQIAAGDRDIKKAALHERLRQFRGTVAGQLAGSVYAAQVPKLPQFGVREADFLRALDNMEELWGRIEEAPPEGYQGPLTLAGGYPLSALKADIVSLRAAFGVVNQIDAEAATAREQRDGVIHPMKLKLAQYRVAVPGAFAKGHPLIASLPDLNPVSSATPEPVTAVGSWNVETSMADLTWSASTNPNLDHYSVRYHPGPTYKANEEQAVATVAAGSEVFHTTFFLPASGSSAWFKVYVVTKSGNERGSNATKITRP